MKERNPGNKLKCSAIIDGELGSSLYIMFSVSR